ncbi:formate hydrogenlyase subunit 3 [Pantoea phytobeneficialis]|uniref:Formate hydrogenlyase subunit 3 n=1 Tax=Pantoea phytobeneficialis TaxID=2052056 RepID=A0AAP9HAH3_9GAMM|nr:formate hydrogenlyase subunit 3 [Pantoea phytobeneficialis]MDO6406743.1 formate hydrogenlyase subunit 3 [Pantoea phytobeneficialis]QGR09271.1 formate hydrogenlyase subunit 3 [Pantoea phytobeneficialis]
MNVFFLIHWALTGLMLSALLAGISAFNRHISGVVAGIGGAISCALLLAASVQGLLGFSAILTLWRWQLQLNSFNSIWLVTVSLCGLFICLFNVSWHRHSQVKANGLLVNLILAAATVALLAANLATLVAMAEIVALAGYFLTGCRKSGQLWFALGRLGTLLLVAACWLLWQQFGTLSFDGLRLALQGAALSPLVLLLSLLGFGLLAGIIPLHGWVPQAHANAPAPAAALFSAVVLKVGLYGMISVSLIADVLPLWWGVLVVVLGMVTAFTGGLYALMEHNINRLLAYHSLENIGIILLGVGCGFIGIALHQPALVALGMIGGLYHLFNHSLFKTTLFLGAGAVWFRTGQHDIEKLGGIGKRMPLISLAMLVGLMAMAALPPLNGFAGEWVIYQSFFQLGNQASFIARVLGPLLAVGLAITGALAVMCMAKVYGVTFLGAPRSPEAEQATNPPGLMNITVVLLALGCVIAGVATPWLLPLLQHAIPLPLNTAQTLVSQPLIALLLIMTPLLPVLLLVLFRGERLPHRTRGPAWVCGYDHEAAMVITASGFAQPVRAAFAPLLALRKHLNPVRWVPGWRGDGIAITFRRLAFIELAILLVAVIA